MGRSWRSFFRSSKEPQTKSGAVVPVPEQDPQSLITVDEAVTGVTPERPATPEAEKDVVGETNRWFGRLRQGLRRSRESFVGQLNAAVAEFRDTGDEGFWERIGEILIPSDVGVPTSPKVV